MRQRRSKGFTVKELIVLEGGDERYIAWDPSRAGFGLRVSPHNHKAFVYAYRFDGRPRMKTLGTFDPDGAHGGLTLKAAIQRYHADAAKVSEAAEARARGEAPAVELDPAAERVVKAHAHRAADSLAQAAEKYLTAMAGKLRPRTVKEYRRVLETYLLPTYEHAKPGSIRKRDLATILDAIAAGEFRGVDSKRKPSKTMAERAKRVFAAFFGWLAERDLIEALPTVHLPEYQKPQRRERYLSDTEAGKFFAVVDAMKASEPVKAALKLALLTGQRIGEVQRMRWPDIAGEWWTIPAEFTKNKRMHRVYLTETARRIVAAMPKFDGMPYVFPGASLDGPMSLQACGKAVARNLATFRKHNVEAFSPHALRHTVRTGLSALRVNLEVKNAVLNHSDGSVGGRYDHHQYDDEKREALTAWERHLRSLMGQGQANVVKMRRRAAR
jgi:integrase